MLTMQAVVTILVCENIEKVDQFIFLEPFCLLEVKVAMAGEGFFFSP